MASQFVITNGMGSGVHLYGTAAHFKTLTAGLNHRYQTSIPIHLGKAKFQLASVEAWFTAIHAGVTIQEGEFQHISQDGYLRITNLDAVTGVNITALEDEFAIPLTYRQREEVIMSNIYPLPEIAPPPLPSIYDAIAHLTMPPMILRAGYESIAQASLVMGGIQLSALATFVPSLDYATLSLNELNILVLNDLFMLHLQ